MTLHLVTCRDTTLLAHRFLTSFSIYTYPGLSSQSAVRPWHHSTVVATDSFLHFTYFPAALVWYVTTSLQTVARRQTGTVHSELDGLSLSREEIETDYRITVLTISISLPPGNLATTYTDYYQQNMLVSSIWMISGENLKKRLYPRHSFQMLYTKDQPPICLWRVVHISQW